MSQYLLRKFKSDGISLEEAIGAHVESLKKIGARASGYRLRTFKSDGHSKTILYPAVTVSGDRGVKVIDASEVDAAQRKKAA